MRTCPKCNRNFPDNTMFCPDDGKSLVNRTVERTSAAPGAGAGSGRAGRGAGHGTPASFGPLDLVGRDFFGAYRVVKKLGEGGMGAVYLAQQNSIDQTIAIKVLHARVAESEEIVLRFHREARVISMLTHPNIIRVFIFGKTDDDLLYLAMEYVDGRTLREFMGNQPMDELEAIKIMKQLCSGLSEAHDLGIIHRDLKPDNVLLTRFRGENNFVKILDFGIAKLKEPDGKAEQQKLTQAGIVYGTPEYLSPEQAQALELDQRTDIYSLGVMLYEMITGRVPFTAQSPVQILTMHVFNEPTPPGQVAPGRVAPTMERIIMKALSKDLSQRYQSAMDMFEDLVGREMEILSERGLDTRSTYVPGMEMTGMYSADQIKQMVAAHATQGSAVAAWAAGSGPPPASNAPPSSAYLPGDDDPLNFAPTTSLAGVRAPMNTTGASGGGHLAGGGGAMAMPHQHMAHQMGAGQNLVNQSDAGTDQTRKLITLMIAGSAFIFVSLVGVIVYLLVTG